MSFLSSMFGGGDLPAPQPAPPAPRDDASAQAARDEAAAEARRRSVAGGRQSTYATTGLGAGDVSAPSLAAKVLLGQ